MRILIYCYIINIMEILRTPDDRFENLEDWDFEPKYKEINSDYAKILKRKHNKK